MAVSRYLGGEGIIVTKADFFDSNGVILVDNGDSVISQQLLECVSGIQVGPPVAQIVQCEQDLCTCLQNTNNSSGLALSN